MRVTNSMVTAAFLNNLSRTYRELAKVNNQISSGKKLERISDDPAAVDRVMRLRTTIDKHENYLRDIDSQIGRLGGSDDALEKANELLQRVSEIAVKGSSGTYNLSDLKNMSFEIDKIIDDMVIAANTTPGAGRNAVFFTRDADGNVVVNPVASPGWAVDEAADGSIFTASLLTETVDPVGVFWGETGSDGVFAVLQNLRDSLAAGDTRGVNSAITALAEKTDVVLQQRSAVGAKVNHLQSLKDQLEEQNLRLTEFAAGLEGTDIAEAAVELQQRQTAYEATLAAGVRLMRASLLDFLK